MSSTPGRRSKRTGVNDGAVKSYAELDEDRSPPKNARRAASKSPARSRAAPLRTPAKEVTPKAATQQPLKSLKPDVKRQLDFEGDGAEGKENNAFDFEEFKDQVDEVAASAVDHYFLGGKTLKTNRARGGRRKANKRGETSEKVADDDDDAELLEKERVKILDKLEELDMAELKQYMEECEESDVHLPPEIQKRNKEQAEWHFPRWHEYMVLGFNLLVHGVGSKRKLLDEFCEQYLKDYTTMIIDGFLPEMNMRAILGALDENMKLKCPIKKRSLTDWAEEIGRAVAAKKTDVILLVNNIDGPNLRDPTEIAALAVLAESTKHVKLVCTVDHVNAGLMFHTRLLDKFNFLYCRFSTMRLPTAEILASDSTVLGLNSKSSNVAHSLSSLDVIWASFPANSRKIFRLFFALFYATNASVSFWDLFSEARDRFLVSSDVALRQQLVEFEDHRIVRIRRSEDGTEKLSAAVDRDLIEKFLTEKGLSLDIDDD